MSNGPFEVGKFSSKSKDVIQNSDAFINILHGAVISSKSISADIAFINHVATSPYDEFLILGKTERTVYRNTIKDLQRMVYPRKAPYNKANAELKLFGKTVYVVGVKDESATDKIKGLTVAGILMDEATTYPKSSFEMATTRASQPGSKIWLTCNPESPYHYINQDYILNTSLHHDGTVKDWSFQLEDNPNLPPDYIDRLKRIYTGVFYQRNILGKWVQAEGAIYPMFNSSEHVFVHQPINQYIKYAVGVDYGTSTACCFLLFGIAEIEDKIHYHVLEEYYHDAQKTGIQLSDTQYADKMVEFIKYHPEAIVYTPHDAASFKRELLNRRVKARTHKPNTLNEIREIQSIMDEGRFMVNDKCEVLKSQIQNYVWDLKAGDKGIEKPLKVDDHSVDALRGPIYANKKRMTVHI